MSTDRQTLVALFVSQLEDSCDDLTTLCLDAAGGDVPLIGTSFRYIGAVLTIHERFCTQSGFSSGDEISAFLQALHKFATEIQHINKDVLRSSAPETYNALQEHLNENTRSGFERALTNLEALTTAGAITHAWRNAFRHHTLNQIWQQPDPWDVPVSLHNLANSGQADVELIELVETIRASICRVQHNILVALSEDERISSGILQLIHPKQPGSHQHLH